MSRFLLFLPLLLAALIGARPAFAADLALDRGDTAWMLTSTALVLMMTIPGLALFYGGMVRKIDTPGDHGAELRHHLPGDRALDDCRLQPRFQWRRRVHRRLQPLHAAWHGRRHGAPLGAFRSQSPSSWRSR